MAKQLALNDPYKRRPLNILDRYQSISWSNDMNNIQINEKWN
jgi:hypothetical protein